MITPSVGAAIPLGSNQTVYSLFAPRVFPLKISSDRPFTVILNTGATMQSIRNNLRHEVIGEIADLEWCRYEGASPGWLIRPPQGSVVICDEPTYRKLLQHARSHQMWSALRDVLLYLVLTGAALALIAVFVLNQ